ncbi:hypothetical protein [Parachitinimonas caeni]|uniref:Uncharacterized protein n=1 Tax=Parachitinimonas caeni TaxID=3031301 RepID=A0ABT7E2P0_9NEIS|nr:hypothetical protein [Parachitinimonas caeni]MDK2126575.1 hypothetical protein [Parachitinimonas caeni]
MRQIEGEAKRRWFTSADFDLYIWHGAWGEFTGFQFCYDKGNGERALTYRDGHFYHALIDDGEYGPALSKSTPILRSAAVFDPAQILQRFAAASQGLPADVADYVRTELTAAVAAAS